MNKKLADHDKPLEENFDSWGQFYETVRPKFTEKT
jgi:hypothetical protein